MKAKQENGPTGAQTMVQMPPAGTRRRGILRRVAVWCVPVTAVALALYLFALPPYAAHRIRQALRDTGLDDWTLEVRAVTLHGLELANLRAGEAGRFRVGSLRASYDLGGLLQKELRQVELDGFEWEIRLVDGALDLGPLGSVRLGESGVSLSIERIDVRASTLLVRRGATTLRILFAGELIRSPEGRLEGRVEARVLGQSLRCVASLASEGERRHLEATIFPGVNAEDGALQGGLAGGALLHATCELEGMAPRSWAVEIGARWPALDQLLAGMHVRAQDGALELSASSDPSLGLAVSTCNLSAETLAVDGRACDDARVDVQALDGRYRVRASASGDGWKLDEFVAELPGELARWLEPDLRVTAHGRGSVDLSAVTSARLPAEVELLELVPVSLRSELVARPTVPDSTAPGTRALLRLLETEVLVGPARVSIPRLGLDRAELGGAFHLSGAFAAESVELALQPGSELHVRGLSPTESSSSLDVPSLAVAVDEPADAAGRIAFRPQGIANALELEFPRLRLRAAELSFEERDIGLQRVGVELPLALSLDTQRLAVRLAQHASLHANSVRFGPRAEDLRMEPVDLELSGAPTLELPREADGALALPAWTSTLVGEARCVLARPARVQGAGLGGTLQRLVLTVGGEGPGPEMEDLHARAEIALESLIHASSGLRLDGLVLELAGPLDASSAAPTATGRFGVESITWHECALPGPTGTLDIRGAAVKAAATWSPTATSALDLAADGHLDGGLDGELALHTRRLEIQEGDALEALFADAAGAHFSGALTLDGRLTLGKSEETSLIVSAEGCSLYSKDGEKRLDGVGLELALEGLAPLRSAGTQRVTWERGKVGELELERGQARFAIESPSAVLVEGIEFTTAASSRFSTLAFRLDPSAPEVELQILCEDVSLAEVLSFISSGRSSGEGKLHGRVGLSIGTGPQAVALGPGHLFATGPGRIQVQDPGLASALLQHGITDVSSRGMPDLPRLLQERILGSLADFAFHTLTFDLLPEEDHIYLRISTQGRGVQIPQDLDMTINLRGFDELFAILLGLDHGLEKGKQ